MTENLIKENNYLKEIIRGTGINSEPFNEDGTVNQNFLKGEILHMTTVQKYYPYGVVKSFNIGSSNNKSHEGLYYFNIKTLKGENVYWWLTLKGNILNPNLHLISPDQKLIEMEKLIKLSVKEEK